ncbi:MAG: TIGR02757 family protein [Planctomycetota bacterium]|jgi:uncharacterized protein (TIGR02757 family)
MNLNQQCSVDKRPATIKDILERLYVKYNHRDFIKPDPLQFVYLYSEPLDMEIVALLAAVLAYGRVEQIEKSLTKLFSCMGKSPCQFIRSFGKTQRNKLCGFRHRFTTGQDISDLLWLLQQVLSRYGSIERFFGQEYDPSDKNIIPALSKFCETMCAMYADRYGGQVSRGLKYLLASPDRGSACKRLNLFLRWMVRDDDVDVGLWKSIDKAKLIVPIDVHMGRLCRILGFYSRKTVSLSTAMEITESFAKIEPTDPVKYDFALSRIGIIENCNGQITNNCENCELFDLCMHKER